MLLNVFYSKLISFRNFIQAFDERPIWSRNALLATIECGAHTLKHLLPVIAYYMITGPWARLWVRFGYDPKLHPEAKMYQLIDFRLRRGECLLLSFQLQL